MPEEGIRLQVVIARAGIASRRTAESIIASGRVAVNGKVVREMGFKVLQSDVVAVDGKALEPEKNKRYILLNKPPRYLCSMSDPEGRPLAVKLVSGEIHERLFHVGRLDFMSSGLIIFTNDGDFAQKIGHPSSGIQKEYLLECREIIPDSFISAFEKGEEIDGTFLRAVSLKRKDQFSVLISLVEGKNREIRKMAERFSLTVRTLTRTKIGRISIEGLKEGEWRELTSAERKELLG